MCAELKRGRQAGRRDSIVVVAEGATDRSGNRISSEYVAGNCCHKGEIAAVAAHHLNDEGSLVAGRGGGEVVDGIDNTVQSSIGR
jgi:hypothetical protein